MIYPPGRSQLKYQRVLGGCFVSVSHIQLFATPWTAVCRLPCPSLSPGACSNSCLSSQWCYLTISASVDPLLLLPLMFPSIRVFSNESALCIRWPKYWNFSFSISPSNEYSGLISFRIDWFEIMYLVSLTYNDIFQIYPCSSMYQYFILFRMNRTIGLYHVLFIHSSVDWHLGCF